MPFDSGNTTREQDSLREGREADNLAALVEAQRIANLHLSEMTGEVLTEADLECP